MKYNCENEFDLNEIYRKLTQPSTTQVVKACDFFKKPTTVSLEKFQQDMNTLFSMATH